MDITVAICTYNGADDVPEVLDHLSRQEELAHIDWEVLVIDNNSTDGTSEVVRQHKKHWNRSAPLRVVTEQQKGLAFARQRAVNEAKGHWIAFLDDDNLPSSDWLAAAIHFAEKHPQAGAFGGQIHGQFETEPPISFGLIKGLFAINEQPEEICYSAGRTLTFGAPGAGLVVRKEAWVESMPKDGLSQRGPIGDEMGEFAEDLEAQWYIYKNGWEIWHNPDMHLVHKISSARFEEDYLNDFLKAEGHARHQMRMVRLESWKRPLAIVAYWGADLWKLMRLALTYKTKLLTDRFVRGRAWMILNTMFSSLTGK